MERPKIKIKPGTIDYILEIIGLTGVICLMFAPLYYFNDLPDKIPTHFNALGRVDSYGNKSFVWLLPSIGLILYIGLTILNKYPHIFNYPTRITNENVERLYKIGSRTIRFVKVAVLLLFVFLNSKIII